MFQWRFVWSKMKGRHGKFVLGMILTAIISAVVVVNPYLSSILVDDVVRGGNHQLLLPILGAMLGVVLIKNALHGWRIYCMEVSSQHMVFQLRMAMFRNIQYQEMSFFDRMRSGDIITRATGDLEYMRHFAAYVTYMLVFMLVTFSSAIVSLCVVNYKLTLCLLGVMPFLLLATVLYSKKVKPVFQSIRFKLSRLNIAATENIAGNRVVKAFAREDYEKEKFDKVSTDFRDANLKAAYAFQKVVPLIDFMAQSLTFLTILIGGIFCIRGEMTIGQLSMFTSLTWALASPMQNVSALLNDFQRFIASADKVIELCCARPLIVDRYDAVDEKERLNGKIEFKNVSFSYGSNKVLDNVSFAVNPGETVAIMGPTGSGKTTIADLIIRFYDVNSGEILLDGVNVRRRTLASIRRTVSVATQDVFLFSDTVDGNIAFCDPKMSEEDVREFSRLAQADGFIGKLTEGYDTVIGERGVGLSGGQRQRIALARAMATKPPVLILDDTTSAVDMETEREIKHSLDNMPYDCTKIIIAQRISSVQNADKIIILKDGKVTVGTHDSLMRTNSYYRDVCELQDVPDMPAFEGGER